jgi:hypothetical protein
LTINYKSNQKQKGDYHLDKLDQIIEDVEKLEKLIDDPLNEGSDGTAKRALENKREELNRERKMRFGTEGGKVSMPDIWIKKGIGREYTLEEIALGRMILNARGEELPNHLEDRFQSLANKSRRYTLTTDGVGTGAELTDVVPFPNLFEDIHKATLVAPLFAPYVQMAAGEVSLHEMGDSIFYKPSGEGIAVSATDLVTAKRSLKAYTIKSQVDISDEETEDAVVEMLSSIRDKLRRNAAEVIDSVILNADTTGSTSNINKYGAAVTGDEDYLLGFDGLIHYCLAEVTGQKTDISTIDTGDFAALMALLDKYADTPERCAFILDRWSNLKAVQLDDFRTVEKAGANATLLRGQIGAIYNIPCIMSPAIAKSDANGRVDGATPGNNTKGRILLVNRDMWKIGLRRAVKVAIQRDEPKTMTSVVCSLRMGLQCFGDRSTATYCHTALGYNGTV